MDSARGWVGRRWDDTDLEGKKKDDEKRRVKLLVYGGKGGIEALKKFRIFFFDSQLDRLLGGNELLYLLYTVD